MKHFIILLLALTGVAGQLAAQDFVTRGKIEYELKINNKRMMGENNQNDEFMQNNIPDFYVGYRDLLFTGEHWIYGPGRPGNMPSYMLSDGSLYAGVEDKEVVVKRQFVDDYFIYKDSLPPLKWKLQNETRKIAGWECRKAVAVIQDSVYVVAFYSPEIIPQAGPELFTGLPGMILGLAIPRYYCTWFATKVELANIDESRIIPPTIKKGKTYDKKELAPIILKKYKDSGWWGDVTLEKVMDQFKTYVLLR